MFSGGIFGGGGGGIVDWKFCCVVFLFVLLFLDAFRERLYGG